MNAISRPAEIDYDLDRELERGRRDGSLISAKQLMLYEHITLPTLAEIIQDAAAPYAVRADLIKFSAKLVGEGVDKTPTAVPAFALQINVPGSLETAGHAPPILAVGTPDTPAALALPTETFVFDPLEFTPDYVPNRFPLLPDLCLEPSVLVRADPPG
jgi:hypothetical protein